MSRALNRLLFLLFLMLSPVEMVGENLGAGEERAALRPGMGNPVIPGYHADPALLEHAGRYYLYATLDPWGGETLGCWESVDFKSWTYRKLTWPTKAACTSATSLGSAVWAPSVVKRADGRFFMYVSVGSEVWVGAAEHPLGPWSNPLGDRPLIPADFRPGYHMIDAEAFIDDDGRAYLYWGSGWNWENGRCWAVRLGRDMASFEGEVADITPPRFFEAPFMIKRGRRYHLMYSSGKTTEDTYQVHSAVGDSPFGPFVEEAASPILVTDRAREVISPGHHAVFVREGRHHILYHRHSVPFDPAFIGRQICVDELNFDERGNVMPVTPTHEGPAWLARGGAAQGEGLRASASSSASVVHGPERVLDDNHATWWRPAADDPAPWLRIEFGVVREVSLLEIVPEYAWRSYAFRAEVSYDGTTWRPVADHMGAPLRGSPWRVGMGVRAREVRLVFAAGAGVAPVAISGLRIE